LSDTEICEQIAVKTELTDLCAIAARSENKEVKGLNDGWRKHLTPQSARKKLFNFNKKRQLLPQ
jgi:hypothetical protein